MKNKKEQRKILITRIFCGFMAAIMIAGVVYTVAVYL